tara:strand:- start:15 stop:1025 length:1011 start_codon:yes stop_codon:yes gene_type:complete
MAYTTIDNPELYFQCKLYTGNATGRDITLDGSENMSPNLVWIKVRSENESHQLYDTIRGVQKRFMTQSSEVSETVSQGLTAFNADGFTLGTGNGANKNTETYVAWCWNESATAGVDILTYDGNSTNRTIAHSLSAVPHMIILKSSTHGEQWVVGHNSMDGSSVPASSAWNNYMHLQSTAATASASNRWQNTAPTSSVFSLGTEDQVNGSKTYIAYLFAPKQGFSRFKSYKGNNSSTNAPFIYTGFRPAFVLIRSVSTTDWNIFDNKRFGFNGKNPTLFANLSNSEDTEFGRIDFLSNGFKIRTTNAQVNNDNTPHIYMAFAESPFVNSKGVPNNAR